jgi:hypothetical protein
MIKPKRMKWVWHVAHMEEIGMSTELVRKLEGNISLLDLGWVGKKTLKWILKKQNVSLWIRFIWCGKESVTYALTIQ